MSDWAGSPARLTLQAMTSAIIVYDAQHRLVMVNQRMLDLAGVDQRWLAPNTPLSDVLVLFMMRGLFGEGDPAAQLAEFTRLDRSKPSRRLLRLTDGTTLEARVQPMADGGFIECFTDVTAFTGPLETSRQDLRLLEEVFNQLSLGVAVFKQDELLLYNPAYPRLTGLPANQARTGLTATQLNDMQAARGEFTPEQREEWEAHRASRDPGKRSSMERRRPNGTALRLETYPLADETTLYEFSDVTAERRAQEEAQRRALLLDIVLAALPIGIAVYGPDQRVRLVNVAFNNIYPGHHLKIGDELETELRARALAGIFGPGDPERHVRKLLTQVARPEAALRRRPVGRLVSLRGEPLPDGGRVIVVSDVTALHDAEARARAQADTLRSMLEGMRHGIALFDSQGRVVAANALAAALCGLPADVMVPGAMLADLSRAQRAAGEFDNTVQRLGFITTAKLAEAPLNYTRTRPDGSIIEVRTDMMPDGGFVRTYSDITELRRAKDQLSAMLEGMRHGIALFDSQDRLVAANALAAQMCGLPADIVLPGAALADMARTQTATGEYDAATQALEFVVSARLAEAPPRYIRNRPDGSVIEVRTNQTPDGGFVRTYSDITELRRAQERLSTMLEGMRHGIVLFDAQHRLAATNGAIRHMLDMPDSLMQPGIPYAEIVDRMRELGLIGSHQGSVDAVMEKLTGDLRQPARYTSTRRDGRVLEAVRDPLPDGGFILTYVDISGSQPTQDAPQAAINPALQAPLSTIIGLAQALQPDAPAQADQLQSIRDAGEHLLAVIDEMLQAARAGQGVSSHQAG